MPATDHVNAAGPPARRRRGRPSPEETKRLEDALLSTATDIFCVRGYSASRMEEIALAAGVGKKALYARYRNKEELFSAVIDHVFPDRAAWNIEGLGEMDAQLSFEQGLLRRARLILFACCNPQPAALFRLVRHESARVPELAAIFDHFTSEIVSALARYFAAEQSRGRICSIDPHTAATMFMLAVVSDISNRIIYQHPMPNSDEIELFAFNMALLFARGLAPTSEQAPPTFAPFAQPSRFSSHAEARAETSPDQP